MGGLTLSSDIWFSTRHLGLCYLIYWARGYSTAAMDYTGRMAVCSVPAIARRSWVSRACGRIGRGCCYGALIARRVCGFRN